MAKSDIHLVNEAESTTVCVVIKFAESVLEDQRTSGSPVDK